MRWFKSDLADSASVKAGGIEAGGFKTGGVDDMGAADCGGKAKGTPGLGPMGGNGGFAPIDAGIGGRAAGGGGVAAAEVEGKPGTFRGGTGPFGMPPIFFPGGGGCGGRDGPCDGFFSSGLSIN